MKFLIFATMLSLFLTQALSEEAMKEEPLETQLERPFLSPDLQEKPETTLENPLVEGSGAEPAKPQGNTQEFDCMPRRCNRMYSPVCASIDGVEVTVPSRCEFSNKMRCASRALRAGKAAPAIRFLRLGPCDETEN